VNVKILKDPRMLKNVWCHWCLWVSFHHYCDFIIATLKSRVITNDLTRLNETIQLLCLDQTWFPSAGCGSLTSHHQTSSGLCWETHAERRQPKTFSLSLEVEKRTRPKMILRGPSYRRISLRPKVQPQEIFCRKSLQRTLLYRQTVPCCPGSTWPR